MAKATLINLDRITDGNPAVASDMKANLQSLRDAVNAIDSEQIAANAVTTGKIASGAVTSDKIASGAATADKLATDAAETAKIKDLAVTTAKLAANAVTAAKTIGLAAAARGQYTGNGGSGDNAVTGLGFTPDFIFINRVNNYDTTAGFKDQAAGSPLKGPLINLNGSGATGASHTNAMQYDSGGFTIPSGKGSSEFNGSGITYSWIAIKITT